MNRLAGQAGRTIGGFLQLLGMLAITVFFVLAVLLGGLAFRLSQGPLQIPWVTTRLANAVSGQDIDIHVGQAALGWEGYKKGGGAPLYLQLGQITVQNGGGAALAAIPDARLEFSPGAIFSGKAAVFVSSSDARFSGADAPVSLLAGIHLGRGFTLVQADLWVTLGAGQIGPPGLAEPIAGGKFLLTVSSNDVALTDGQFTLPPTGGSAPVIRVTGNAHRAGLWHGAVTVTGNAVQAQDLPQYWPLQLAAQTRSWVTTNITAGAASAASFTFKFSASTHLADITLDDAQGGFKAEDVALTWLPGAQQITKLNGRFTLTDADDIEIAADSGTLGGIRLSAASMHIAGVAHRDQTGTLHIPVAGSVQSVFAMLNAPPLRLLKTMPVPVLGATGDMTGTVDVVLPFKQTLSIDDVDLTVAAALTDVTIPLPVDGMILDRGSLAVEATMKKLKVAGKATLLGQPAKLSTSAIFGPGAAAVRFEMTTTVTDKTLTTFGLNPNAGISGAIPLDIRIVTTPANTGSLTVSAELLHAGLKLPIFGWTKPAGTAGKFNFAASINGDNFSGIDRIDSIDAKAPGLDIQTQEKAGGLNLTRIHIGNTEGSGRIVPPEAANAPWRVDVFGNVLDASSAINPPQPGSHRSKITKPEPAAPFVPEQPSGFLWRATAHFDHLLLAEAPATGLSDFDFDGDGQGNSVFDGSASALLGSGGTVDLAISPVPGSKPGYAEELHLQTEDGGELLRAMDAYDDLKGGVLDLNASYGAATATILGKTTINNFRLLNAPAFGKFLQAITVLGIPEATSGPGLQFSKLIAPFSIEDQVLTLREARAYSAALGFTASGTIDLNAGTYDIHGTVVPAYALNTLPGKIPLIGKLFSPEKGGGLFAMRYSMTGTAADPKVTVNPFSVLTPGFLRGIFGLGKELEAK